MAEIAVAVRDPSGNKFAQLLHDDLPVRELTLILADRLSLPTKINYQLINLANGKPLDASRSLRAAKVSAGSELQLKPIRDKAFDLLVEALKEEIAGEIKGEVKKEAAKTLGRLLGEPSAGSSTTAGSPPSEPAAQAAKSSSSCLRTGCLVMVLAAVAALAAGAIFYDDYVKPVIDELVPGLTSGEPRLGTGDVQVTLRWENPVDLDLHVIDPAGEEIYFSHPTSQSGGTLDVDANASCSNEAPVENIYWPAGGAPFGTFQVYVVYYQGCGYSDFNSYTVTILVDGQRLGPYEGVLSNPGEEHFITSFSR